MNLKNMAALLIFLSGMSGVSQAEQIYNDSVFVVGKFRMGPNTNDIHQPNWLSTTVAPTQSPNNGGTWSVAMGYGANSLGAYSYALGREASSGGSYSYALGFKANASADYSVALGYKSSASGPHSIVLGRESSVEDSADYGIAMGNGAKVAKLNAADPACPYGIAVGHLAQASGPSAIAIGSVCIAQGMSSLALGYSNNAVGKYSCAIGVGTYSKALYSTALGSANVQDTESSDTTWVATDPLLVIGNGTSTSTRSNGFVMKKNANIRTGGNLETKGVIRSARGGDLSMGSFTAGQDPAQLSATTLEY